MKSASFFCLAALSPSLSFAFLSLPVSGQEDPLLRQLMDSPIYREQLLDPPDRNQNLHHKEKPARENLFLRKNYAHDPLLGQLLSKYHDDFLNILSPPDYKQDPLLRQLVTSLGSDSRPAVIFPPPVKQNYLFRKLPSTKQGSINDGILRAPKYGKDHQDPLLAHKDKHEIDVFALPPYTYNQDQLQGHKSGAIQLQPPSYRQNPLLRQLPSIPSIPSMPARESIHISLKVPPVTTKQARLQLIREEKQRPESTKADRILNMNSHAKDPLLRPLQNTPSTQQYNFLRPPQSESNFQSLLEDLTNAVQIFKTNELKKQQKTKSLPLTKQVKGGVDFSLGTLTEDGRLCVVKEDTIDSMEKSPVMQCTHSDEEKCHYTYITFFTPTQEEVCEDHFEKKCQITFRKEASKETVKKCYKPMSKTCNGQGPTKCRAEFETSCSTKYVELSPENFIGDSRCVKIPFQICGEGCSAEEGEEECHDKHVDILVDVPEEVCDIIPQKTCRHATKLVPSLRPTKECTTVPKEICNLNFGQGKVVKKPLRTEWCLESESEILQPRTKNLNNRFDDILDNPAYTAGIVKFRQ